MAGQQAFRILSTTAMKLTLDALAPTILRESGAVLGVTCAPTTRIVSRIRGGEPFDAAMLADFGADELIGEGLARDRLDIAKSEIAVGVPAGAPKPDISTVESFKRTLLAARSIALSGLEGGGQSGIHMQKVLEMTGLAEPLRDKIVYGGGGHEGLIARFLLDGRAELGIQQNSELLALGGVDIVGPLPRPLDCTTTFSLTALSGTKQPDVFALLAKLLRGSEGISAIRAGGLTRA